MKKHYPFSFNFSISQLIAKYSYFQIIGASSSTDYEYVIGLASNSFHASFAYDAAPR
jgi:hypothetical protein